MEKETEEINIYSNIYPPVVIIWRRVISILILHVGALFGLYSTVTCQVKWKTILLGFVFHFLGILCTTAGAHRLWCHKSYKAKFPLRVFLALGQAIAFQGSIYEWSREHRIHHKYSETLADPHNSKRGFFFSHVGWLVCQEHEAVGIKRKEIILSDLHADPIVMFQHRYFTILAYLLALVFPSVAAWNFWDETLFNSITITLLRYTITLNVTWSVNSAAHMWGTQPYDRLKDPRQNKLVSFLALGEGWHNYHHTFPWDYKAAEFGPYKYNVTTAFLDLMAKLGQAYDLKTVSENVIRERVGKRGDGSHPLSLGVKTQNGNTLNECGPY